MLLATDLCLFKMLLCIPEKPQDKSSLFLYVKNLSRDENAVISKKVTHGCIYFSLYKCEPID